MSHRFVIITSLFCLLGVDVAHGQMLSTLWPATVGNRWEYDALLQEFGFPDESFQVTLELTGSSVVNGDVGVYTLTATQSPLTAARAPRELSGFWRTLWLARPDLREEIERIAPGKGAADFIPFDLVGDGLLRIAPEAIGMWREDLDGWAIWYLTSDLTPGASFMLQLVPELADDVFLHGTVEAVGVAVTVPGGAFTNAVEMSYRIDFGLQSVTDVDGGQIGTFEAQTLATGHFVPLLGPVRLEERHEFINIDCPTGCPEVEALEGEILRHGLLELRLQTVPAAVSSWGSVKSTFVD